MKPMSDLQEIALLLTTAESVEERRLVHEILRSTETVIESAEELSIVDAD
jgi:hypothetical protein